MPKTGRSEGTRQAEAKGKARDALVELRSVRDPIGVSIIGNVKEHAKRKALTGKARVQVGDKGIAPIEAEIEEDFAEARKRESYAKHAAQARSLRLKPMTYEDWNKARKGE